MNIATRIKKIEKKLSDEQSVARLGTPIVELTPEQKLTWPKGLPYPILGGLSTYEMPEDTK